MRVLSIFGVLATGFLVWVRLGCRHDVKTVPINDEQMCLLCGAHRRFVLGKKPGPWKK